MSASDYKAILFDVDDTLVKTWVVKFRQHKFVAKKYYGVELTDEKLLENWGKPMHKLIEGIYGELASPEEGMANYLRHAPDFPKEPQGDTLKTLKILHQAGLKLGVVTSWLRHRLESELDHYGIPGKYLDVIQGSEDSDYHKPDPRVFEPALEQLKGHGITDGIVYVGDAIMDYEAARDAGFHFVGVTTGMVDAKTFRRAGASHVIGHLGELPAALNL